MQKVKLGDAFYLQMGKTPARNNKDYWGGNIKWAAISDLGKDKYLHTTEECITEKAVIESGIKPVPSDTIIMSFKLSIGKVAITSEEVYTNEAIMAFIDKGIYDFDIDYLYYLFSGYNWTIGTNKAVKGLTLNKATLSEKVIAFPTLTVQKAIAEKLDKVSILIEKRKQQFSLLDTLVKSKFVEMFGDFDLRHTQSNWLQIGKMATVVGGSTPKTENAKYWGGDYCWITPAELADDSFIVQDTIRKITKEGVNSCSLKKLPVGTVLLSSRAPIGKVAITGVEMYCNQGFKNLICSKSLNPIYVYYLLKFNTDYLNSLGRGATFKEISKSIVENILIPIPLLDVQNKFADFVKKTDKLKEKIKHSLAALELLKKSLMQKYFG